MQLRDPRDVYLLGIQVDPKIRFGERKLCPRDICAQSGTGRR
jgi:hypothetical protein